MSRLSSIVPFGLSLSKAFVGLSGEHVSFYVYILRCVDYSYYVGHADDLERRLAMHNAGEIPGYTEGRRPLRLVYVQEFGTREEALATERRLKGWSRAKKEALILENWDRLRLLARSRGPSAGAAKRSPSTSSGRTDTATACGITVGGWL